MNKLLLTLRKMSDVLGKITLSTICQCAETAADSHIDGFSLFKSLVIKKKIALKKSLFYERPSWMI